MKLKFLARLFFCLFTLQFLSCAARINGSIGADGSASMSVNMSLEPRITSLIGRMSAAGGVAAGGNILDGPAIAGSMSKAPGIASVSFKNTASSAIEGAVRISKTSDFLAATGKDGFINFEQGRSGGKFTVNINRGNGLAIFEKLSPEITEYLYALMAPIVTGENLSKTEYLEEITAFYNKPISDEIAGSRIRLSLDFPGNVISVKGGTFSGKRADFDVALLDLLVLETPLVYEVNWK